MKKQPFVLTFAVVLFSIGITTALFVNAQVRNPNRKAPNQATIQNGDYTPSASVPHNNVSQAAKSKWLVMVYLAGDNSLSEDCISDLTEMSKAELNNAVVVAQLDTGIHDGTQITIKPGIRPGELINELNRSREVQRTANKALAAGSPEGQHTAQKYFEAVRSFVDRNIRAYPGHRYMLVLSGHGSGSVGDFLRKELADRNDSLSVNSLGELLRGVNDTINKVNGQGQLDILGLDSCLMSMTEVAFAVHKHAKIMIGAEGFEPRAGWPYKTVLEALNNPNGNDVELKSLAQNIVRAYIHHYTDYQAAGVSVDQAAADLSQTESLSEAVRTLTGTLLRYLPRSKSEAASGLNKIDPEVQAALVLAHWESQSYKNEKYTDLYDFCQVLQARCQKADVKRACQNVMNAIRGSKAEGKAAAQADPDFRNLEGFVVKSCYSGLTVQYSYGVSIYFPWSENKAELSQYETLDFAKTSKWAEFLRAYLSATKRPPRPGEGIAQSFDQTDMVVSEAGATASVGHRNGAENKNGMENKNGEENKYGSQTKDGSVNRNGLENKHGSEDKDGSPNRDGSYSKDGIENKNIGRRNGSMRNPPTEFYRCDCNR